MLPAPSRLGELTPKAKPAAAGLPQPRATPKAWSCLAWRRTHSSGRQTLHAALKAESTQAPIVFFRVEPDDDAVACHESRKPTTSLFFDQLAHRFPLSARILIPVTDCAGQKNSRAVEPRAPLGRPHRITPYAGVIRFSPVAPLFTRFNGIEAILERRPCARDKSFQQMC